MSTKKQIDEIVKLVAILKDSSIPEVEKMVAEKRLQQIKDDVTASQYNLPKDRIPDVQFLERVANNPLVSEFRRKQAKDAIKKIVNESKAIRSMRQSLIKEMKKGRADNIKDISEYVKNHSHLQ